MTRYIVDNLANQSITGQLRIDGGLTVTDGTYSTLTYRALLTKTGVVTATDLQDIDGGLIIGETYTIDTYVLGDDFANVANVISGTISETGCVFVATGEVPRIWSNGSTLISGDTFIVNVLENTLGYELDWETSFGPGIYIAYPSVIGLRYNNFPRQNVSITTNTQFFGTPLDYDYVKYFAKTGSLTAKDDLIYIQSWDVTNQDTIDDKLYYTLVEIKMKQNLDMTPVTIQGLVSPSYPFADASVELKLDDPFGFYPPYVIETFPSDTGTFNNLGELITQLNSDPITSFLGVYSDDGTGNIQLTMPQYLYERFTPFGELNFDVYSD
jgi:hypothetical protein